MKRYSVKVPIAGYAIVEVDADDEESAIEKAVDNVTVDDLESWAALRIICEGNVMYADCNEAEAELIDDDEDERKDGE